MSHSWQCGCQIVFRGSPLFSHCKSNWSVAQGPSHNQLSNDWVARRDISFILMKVLIIFPKHEGNLLTWRLMVKIDFGQAPFPGGEQRRWHPSRRNDYFAAAPRIYLALASLAGGRGLEGRWRCQVRPFSPGGGCACTFAVSEHVWCDARGRRVGGAGDNRPLSARQPWRPSMVPSPSRRATASVSRTETGCPVRIATRA